MSPARMETAQWPAWRAGSTWWINAYSRIWSAWLIGTVKLELVVDQGVEDVEECGIVRVLDVLLIP